MKPVLYKIIISIILMLLIIQFWGAITFSAGPVDLELHFKILGSGDTIVRFPPLGRITVPTHIPPVDLQVTLDNINMQELRRLVENNTTDSLLQQFFVDVRNSVIMYATSLLIAAFITGICVSLLWEKFKNGSTKFFKKEAFCLGAVNLFVLLFIFTIKFLSFNPAAFSEGEKIEYEGVLEAAPWVFEVLEEGTDVIDNIGIQFAEIRENVAVLKEEIEKEAKPEEDVVTVLHVSDIHNNSVAFDVMNYVKEIFHVDMIVDTGDLIDYGTSLEVDFFTRIDTLGVPYVLIPGNHESPSAVSHLEEIENVLVIEEGVEEVEELKIAGLADPSASSTAMEVKDEAAIEKGALKLEEINENAGGADIIATHNPEMLKEVRKDGNFLLTGHTHTPYINKENEYVEINAGSTGASGSRGIQNMKMKYSLVLINFYYCEEEKSYVPFSADLIKVEPFPLNFNLERHIF